METDIEAVRALKQWRQSERKRLLAARQEMSAFERRQLGERIAASLDRVIGDAVGTLVGVYWPIRGEPNLLRWSANWLARGGTCALPVVVQPQAPLVFRQWRAGDKLVRGTWNIPIPDHGVEVEPDILIAPVVGFDPDCYRLGYGGGFYDRTIAARGGALRVIGVGYAHAAIPTIHPQTYDRPMTCIVTENGISTPATRDNAKPTE